MINVEELIAGQYEVAESIKKILINYKKDSDGRKNEEYIKQRLTNLDNFWADFCQRHEQIKVDETHQYVKSRIFDQVEDKYNTTKLVLSEKCEALLVQQQLQRASKTPTATPSPNQLRLHIPPPAIPSGSKTILTPKSVGLVEKPPNSDLPMKLLRLQMSKLNGLRELIGQITDHEDQMFYVQYAEFINTKWMDIEKNHDQIIMEASGKILDEPYFAESQFEVIQSEYYKIMVYLRTKMQYQPKSTINVNETDSGLRLPHIKIPSFNGDYKSWVSFHDLFNQTINNNRNLGNAQKLHYLKTLITGEAASIINHLAISDNNYITAWELLNNRYNNERLLVNTQLGVLLSQPSLQYENSMGLKKLHDTTIECLNALKNLGINIDSWDPIVIYVTSQKLDKDTLKLYEQTLQSPKKLQSFAEFTGFLENRFQSLESSKSNNKHFGLQTISKPKFEERRNFIPRSIHHAHVELNCICCKKQHKLYMCSTYNQMIPTKRMDIIKNNRLCWNCLTSHKAGQCKSEQRCRKCNRQHHTSLHDAFNQSGSSSAIDRKRNDETRQINESNVEVTSHLLQGKKDNILLATAMVLANGQNGSVQPLRALIDQGSQASFITEEAAQRLRLRKTKVVTTVSGIGASRNLSQGMVTIIIKPNHCSNFETSVTAYVMRKITRALPDDYISNQWEHTKNLVLADPNFNTPSKIDLLLGAATLEEIMMTGIIKGPSGTPMAQETSLGWILSGRTKTSSPRNISVLTHISLDDQLKKFWELEELPKTKVLSKEEITCEKHFQQTHIRNDDGGFTVQLPFDTSVTEGLGESRSRALARFVQLEKTFNKNPTLHKEYSKFINEYVRLGHMKLIRSDLAESESYYLPHHAVFKENSSTTKLRVVFDASAKTSNGTSLNDKLLVGPTIQEDLWMILLRWRKYKYVFSADIEKMYRQINIAPEHQRYQQILWRESPEQKIKEYKLTTVTYGTSCAPYLAIKTLNHLASIEEYRYPAAAKVVKEDFYVDDLMTGAFDTTKAIELQGQLIQLLKSGKFNLRKWVCNNNEILQNIPEDLKEFGSQQLGEDDTFKTLGILWNPVTDHFEFKINLSANDKPLTKRKLLSESSKIFDPLGWLAPITIISKILFQDTWTTGLAWDNVLPMSIQIKWNNFQTNLKQAENIKIRRWTGQTNNDDYTELHGFCDASEKAYAAVVYVKTFTKYKAPVITLLTAKTKVAPLKTISIPRLELCAAVLLAKLLFQVGKAIKLNTWATFAWTDSMITLAWIKGHPNTWQTFVANRVAEIQQYTNPICWNHVKSSDNPADCASRGITPIELKNYELWWSGPAWLKTNEYGKVNINEIDIPLLEKRKPVALATIINPTEDIIEKYSSFSKLTKIIGYCVRFINNTQAAKSKRVGAIQIDEIDEAVHKIVLLVQEKHFNEDILHLKKHHALAPKSKLKTLYPFLDKKGILRVGGRLEHASLPFDQKHPMIIPYKSHLTDLILQKAHLDSLHGTKLLTLAFTRKKFWIIDGMNAVKQHIHHCIRCYKNKAHAMKQLMGNLPPVRVNLSKAFENCGVDFAGPVAVRPSKGRGIRSIKGYIAIFVCMSTKAIHLELVSDLTAEAFIAAIRRFSARRGEIRHIYSDNGTNFVKSNKILEQNNVENELRDKGIQWHFIPPASPHFGGLWEAAVKSMKSHMYATIGEERLTFEEYTTLLCQIEATLNARPLCPLNMDPNDLEYLTPGHFLLGSSMYLPPDREENGRNTLNRWHLVQTLYQNICKKWKHDYLHQLQNRTKWHKEERNIKVGDLVLLKEDTKPQHWPMARIIEVHPGTDNLVRVVTLKTERNIIKRPISKICSLPLNESINLTTDVPIKTNDQPAINIKGKSQHKKSTSVHPPSVNLYTSSPVWHGSQKLKRKEIKEEEFYDIYNQSKKCKKSNVISKSLLYLAIISCAIISQVQAQQLPYELKPFKNQPGIYFEKTNNVRLINDQWSIIAYYDLSMYWAEFSAFERIIKELNETCANVIMSCHPTYTPVDPTRNSTETCVNIHSTIVTTCHQLTDQLIHHLDTIRSKNELIFHDHNRSKRSPFDVIGTIANELFGVLDQRAAKRIAEDIDRTKSDEEHIMKLINNQTSIIESTVNLMKKSQHLINAQFQTISTKLDTFQKRARHNNVGITLSYDNV